jgi:OOP family OmpA-OmpF porin
VKIKPAGKLVALIIILGALFGAFRYLSGGKGISSFLPGAKETVSTVPIKIDLPQFNGSAVPSSVKDMTMPGNNKYTGGGDQVRGLVWAWNAQMGLMFANGGPETTNGSIVAKHEMSVKLTRQDDSSKMQESLVEFATQLSQGVAQPTRGSHFVCIMGDGAATFLEGVNSTLKKIGDEYTAKIVGTCGFSRGEDKFMGPDSWRQNAAASKGGVVSGYLRDGDWNIAMKWLGDNGLKNNPDEKTYDPDALNWIAANDYIDAAEKYITGYTEERDVVKDGKKTGEKKKIHVDGVVTWTPGDVSIAGKKGGIVSIVSTKEYSAQMPCVIIMIDKWCRQNSGKVENLIASVCDGADAVRSSTDALKKAGEVSQEVYQEKNADAAYWVRYYNGNTEKDATGVQIALGGSAVNNLADNLLVFGKVPGSANVYKAVYETFGNIVVQQYPNLVKSYPAYDSIVDTTYLLNVAKKMSVDPSTVVAGSSTAAPTRKSDGGHSTPVSRKNYDIKFATGRASFAGSATSELSYRQRRKFRCQHEALRISSLCGQSLVRKELS